MQINENEFRKKVAKMERGIPVHKDEQVLCVVTLKSGDETTNYFSLEELESLLTKRAADESTTEALIANICDEVQSMMYAGNGDMDDLRRFLRERFRQ